MRISKQEPVSIDSYDSVTTWTIELDGDNQRRLTRWRNGLETVPSSFSPDGALLTASQIEEDGNGPKYKAIALRTDGSASSVLAADAMSPSFSPDGSQIAMLVRRVPGETKGGRSRSYRGALVVMRSDGTERRYLAPTTFFDERTPSWDPAGERLVYGERQTIVEINADGTCKRKVLTQTATLFYFGAAWQPGPGREAGPITC
jgi:Tol biopolymer transport system component